MSELAVNGGIPVRTKPFPTWPVYDHREEQALLEVMRSGKWGGYDPRKILEFEAKFSHLQDAGYAVSVVNGTFAISVALMAARVSTGDEVIMPPYTFIATASAPLMFGAIPVFVDVEPDTLLIDPEKVEAAITPRTKAIVAVHIAGAPANMTRLKQIAEIHGLRLIEDAAQAVGARWNNVGVGAIGDLGTFSFQSSKNLNAGEGGVVITNDKALADYAWSLSNVGRIRNGGWYQHEIVGWNCRMTEFQASILLTQMERLSEQFERREKNAKYLNDLLTQLDGVMTLRRYPETTHHANHIFMFRLDPALASRTEKAEVISRIQAEGIPMASGYVPLNKNHAVIAETQKWLGEKRVFSCPVAEQASEQGVLWLGQSVLLGDDEDMHDIYRAVAKVIASFS